MFVYIYNILTCTYLQKLSHMCHLYVQIYIQIYIYIYICIYVYTHSYVCTNLRTFVLGVCLCLSLYLTLYLCLCFCISVCISVSSPPLVVGRVGGGSWRQGVALVWYRCGATRHSDWQFSPCDTLLSFFRTCL